MPLIQGNTCAHKSVQGQANPEGRMMRQHGQKRMLQNVSIVDHWLIGL